MARQTFKKGQRVYIKRFGGSYQEAVVILPDVLQSSYGSTGRKMHYVRIRYIRNGELVGNEWPVLNNRQQIITAEANAEIERGHAITRLHNTIGTYTRWETKFAAYIEQAKGIISLVQTRGSAAQPSCVELLAMRLSGTFDIRNESYRHSVEEIAELRAERKNEAEEAQQALEKLGATKIWGQAPEAGSTA